MSIGSTFSRFHAARISIHFRDGSYQEWGHWMHPEGPPRVEYRGHFAVVVLPDGQEHAWPDHLILDVLVKPYVHISPGPNAFDPNGAL